MRDVCESATASSPNGTSRTTHPSAPPPAEDSHNTRGILRQVWAVAAGPRSQTGAVFPFRRSGYTSLRYIPLQHIIFLFEGFWFKVVGQNSEVYPPSKYICLKCVFESTVYLDREGGGYGSGRMYCVPTQAVCCPCVFLLCLGDAMSPIPMFSHVKHVKHINAIRPRILRGGGWLPASLYWSSAQDMITYLLLVELDPFTTILLVLLYLKLFQFLIVEMKLSIQGCKNGAKKLVSRRTPLSLALEWPQGRGLPPHCRFLRLAALTCFGQPLARRTMGTCCWSWSPTSSWPRGLLRDPLPPRGHEGICGWVGPVGKLVFFLVLAKMPQQTGSWGFSGKLADPLLNLPSWLRSFPPG